MRHSCFKSLSLAWALALCALSGGPGDASGLGRIPYDAELRHEIETLFMERDPVREGERYRVSFEKLAARRADFRRKRSFLRDHLSTHATRREKGSAEESGGKGASAKKIAKRVAKADTMRALEHILTLLDQLEREADPAAAYALAAEVLMVDYATRSYTDPLSSLKIPVHIWNIFVEWDFPNATRRGGGSREAANLVDPETGLFLEAPDLEARIAAGDDLSRFEPAPNSPIWEPPGDVAARDLTRIYLERRLPMYPDPGEISLPGDDAVFVYDGAHLTQSKPKIDATYAGPACRARAPGKRKQCQLRMKLKFGMETHADPVGNALLAVLGFNADLSVHIKRPKLYLGKATLEELRHDWAAYFDLQRLHTFIPLDSVITEIGEDERGRYLVFSEAVAELRPEGIDRVGFFPFGELMARGMREVRGLAALNAWFANSDMKDEENNKLVLTKHAGEDTARMHLVQQDVGFLLGHVLPERVDTFGWDLLDRDPLSRLYGLVRGRTELGYVNLQQASLENIPTYADLRWMTRLIAQLTRGQIEAAVSLGRFPGGIGALYVEKLINRRNQLVEAFDLTDEFASLPVDRKLTTPDGSVVDGRLVQTRWEDSSIEYGHHWRDVFRPAARYLWDSFLAVAGRGLGAVDVIDPGRARTEDGLRFTPEILIRLQRQIERNPYAQSDDDQVIVLDTLMLGLRPRIGLVGHGEVAFQQQLALAYPVRDVHEAVRTRRSPIDFLLPRDVRRGSLPERYVLMREARARPGLRATTEDTRPLAFLGFDASLGKVYARRSIVDHRRAGVETLLWRDQVKLLDSENRAFLDFVFVRVPFARAGGATGTLGGELWRFAAGSQPGLVDDVVRHDHVGALPVQGGAAPLRLRSDHRSRSWRWTAILWGGAMRSGAERVHVGDNAQPRLQFERSEHFAWQLLDNSEVHGSEIRAWLENGEAKLRLRFSVDDSNTHSDELDRYYDFASELSREEPLLPEGFVASEWEVSGERRGRWTQMLADVDVELRAGALAALLRVDPQDYWRALARRLDIGSEAFGALRNELRCDFPIKCRARRASREKASLHRLFVRSERLLAALARAQSVPDPEQRLALLVERVLPLSVRRVRGAFDSKLLGSLLDAAGFAELVERGELWLSASIDTSFEDEKNTPEKKPIVGEIGQRSRERAIHYDFFPESPVALYHALDWAKQAERASPASESSTPTKLQNPILPEQP